MISLDHEIENKLIDYRDSCAKYGEAKAERYTHDKLTKTVLAEAAHRAKERGAKTVAEQERDAYRDPDYRRHLTEEGKAIRSEEIARAEKNIHELWFELYRTESADKRAERKGYGA